MIKSSVQKLECCLKDLLESKEYDNREYYFEKRISAKATIMTIKFFTGTNKNNRHDEFAKFINPLIKAVRGSAQYYPQGPSIILTIHNESLIENVDSLQNLTTSIKAGSKFNLF